MIQAYSQNVNANANSDIPFQVVKIDKGCFESLNGTGSFDLNHCGVYRVTVNGTVTPSEAGEIGVELFKDGVGQVETLTQITAAAATLYPFSFTTFIPANRNNGNCACSTPTVLNVRNTGVAATYNINLTIDKVC